MSGRKSKSESMLQGAVTPVLTRELLLSAIADTAEDSVFCKDLSLRYTFVNAAMARLIGKPSAEIVGKRASEIFDANDAEIIEEIDRPVLTGQVVDVVRALRMGSTQNYFHTVQTPIRNDDGKIVGICGIVRDVTDTVKIKKDLVASREMFAMAFATSVDLVAICTADDFRLIEVNDAFLNTLDLNRVEVIGKALVELEIGIDESVKNAVVAAIGPTGSVRDIEVSLKKKRGDWVYGLLSASVVEHSRGRLVLMMMKDISQRKQAERLLRIQRDLSVAASTAPGPEEIIECLLEYSLRIEGLDSGGVFTIDEKSGDAALVMSAGFTEDFVQSVSASADKSLLKELFAADAATYACFADMHLPMDDIRDGEGLKAVAVVPIKHDNKIIGALSLASHTLLNFPLNTKHTIEAVSGMIGGVFARAKAEKALRESEEKLRQSEKMQAIGQLAGGVAHDFNNQLMGITGYADLLSEAVKRDPKCLRFVENILLSARRAADLTAQLLAFARKGKYLSVSVDIHKTIQEVIALLSHSIDKQIVIRRHLRADPCVTTGDPTQLQSAVLNLALNARDAMPFGGELIFTSDVVTFEDPRSWDNPPFDLMPGRYLSIGVSDTGEGMVPEVKRHIFEPFFTTKEQGKGTGMGLAAVFGTIKNHRGAVTVDSAPNKGTSFRILLPLHAPEELQPEVSTASGSPDFAGLRVLLVDDEDMVLKVGREMLSYLGCTTRICRNGKEGVKMVQRHPADFDLVILDMVMPEMNGKDAMLRIKKINPALRILLSSGYSMGEKISVHTKDPSIQFIQKPFRLEELSIKMEELLSALPKRTLQE